MRARRADFSIIPATVPRLVSDADDNNQTSVRQRDRGFRPGDVLMAEG